MDKKKKKNQIITATFVLPALLVFVFTIVIPLVSGIKIAFTNWNGLATDYQFVGFKNLWILLKDKQIIRPIENTLFYTVATVIVINSMGLLMAIALNRKFRGAKTLRALIFSPMITSLVIASFIWAYIFRDVFPRVFGIEGFLGNPKTVMYAIILICIWRDTGFCAIIYSAGLSAVPDDLLEAATIDGANRWQRFRMVTFKMIAPAFTNCITLWIGYGLKCYDYPVAATGGGPGQSSQTITMYVFQQMFQNNRAGYGQMGALVLTILIIIITSVITYILRKREDDIYG